MASGHDDDDDLSAVTIKMYETYPRVRTGAKVIDITVELGYIGLGLYRIIGYKVPGPHNTKQRCFFVYIGFRIYRINFAVRRDPIYQSSSLDYSEVAL